MYPDQHNYLIHWLKKGEKAKYVDKIKLANGRWRYFYTQAELEAYKLKQKLSTSASELAGKAKQGLHGMKEGALDAGARAVVGVAGIHPKIAQKLGAGYKWDSNGLNYLANNQQRTSNAYQRAAAINSAAAASRARVVRKAGGNPDTDLDVFTQRGRAENYGRQAQFTGANASDERNYAAAYKKAYEQTVLGKAEARVKRADVRKATEATRKTLLGAKDNPKYQDAAKQHQESKPTTQTPQGQKVGSIFKDPQGDLVRQRKEREERQKKSQRPQSRKKRVTSGGTGVHKRRRVDLNRFER